MKHTLVSCAFALIAVVCLVSCGKPKQTLHIYNWGDYLADSVVEKFEKEFNCEVVSSEIIPSENEVDKKLPVICMILKKK